MNQLGLVCKGIIISAFLGCFIMSCGPQKETKELLDTYRTSPDSIKAKVKEGLHIHIGNPINLRQSPYLYYPLSSVPLSFLFLEVSTPHDESIHSRVNDYPDRIWNILFVNPETTEKHLLFKDQKVWIETLPGETVYTYENWEEMNTFLANEIRPKFLFFMAKSFDANGDGLLNRNDPTYLYASDQDGRNIKLLSPEGLHVTSWRFIKPGLRLLELTVQKKKEFRVEYEAEDPRRFWIASLDSGWVRPTFPEKNMEPLKEIYLKLHSD